MPVTLDKGVFATVLRESRKGLSGGLWGARYEYFKSCLEDDTALDVLYDVAQRVARAEIPTTIRDAMLFSSLTAILKPNSRVRGISAGDTFRRLVAKTLARQCHEALRTTVWPFNFGLHDRSGTDAAIHLIQYLTDADPDKVVLSIDGVGAFDHVCRTRMFEQLMANGHLHELLPFVRQWYAVPSQFKWKNNAGITKTISQADGGEQGDALMPALFCLALDPALRQVRARLPPGAEIVAYLDDIYIICNPEHVANIFDDVRLTLQSVCHIDVNLGKLAAWSKHANPCPPGLADRADNPWVHDRPEAERGMRILGAPFGTVAYTEAFGSNLLEEKEKLLNFLPKLPSLQSAWLLLYFCAVPRLNHLLRTTPPTASRRTAEMHDQNVLDTFRRLFGIGSPDSWDPDLHDIHYDTWVMQARLPLRYGGLGLRDCVLLAPAAYWASWADYLRSLVMGFPTIGRDMLFHLTTLDNGGPLVPGAQPDCLRAAEEAGRYCDNGNWTDRPLWATLAIDNTPPAPPPLPLSLGEWSHGWQFHASSGLLRQQYRALLCTLGGGPHARTNAATTGKARLRSCMGPYAATWLTVCPTTDKLTMDNETTLCAIRRRLGIGVLFEGRDPHGHSKMTDNTHGRLNARHTWMIAAWRQVCTEGGGLIPDRNVERTLSNTHIPVPAGDTRRLDLIVPCTNVVRGLPLFCDVTVLSPIQRTGAPRPGTSNRAGGLLETAENQNNNTYHEVRDSGLGALYCLGCEVYGRWGNQSIQLVPALARERCRFLPARVRRGIEFGLLHRWWGLLGIALQRSVAHMVLHDPGDLPTTSLEPAPGLADLEVL